MFFRFSFRFVPVVPVVVVLVVVVVVRVLELLPSLPSCPCPAEADNSAGEVEPPPDVAAGVGELPPGAELPPAPPAPDELPRAPARLWFPNLSTPSFAAEMSADPSIDGSNRFEPPADAPRLLSPRPWDTEEPAIPEEEEDEDCE